MPPLPQRRNAAYLNRRISRFGWLDRELKGLGTDAWTGLALDLGGSLEQHDRPDDLGVAYLDGLLASLAPLDRRAQTNCSSLLGICAF